LAEQTREFLRTTFDASAELYDSARPDYPAALFDAMIEATGIRPGDRLLEIGCATGKATEPLARRGFRITCVELGHALAAVARQRLARFPQVEVVEGAFEDWDPRTRDDPFGLVFAATSWHWIDPAVRYPRAHALLRRGGHLAFWSALHVFPPGGDPFFRELQEVYEEIGEPALTLWPRPGELRDERAEIAASGLFDPVAVQHFDWELTYDAEGYIRLLETFSDHLARASWQRERLHAEIRRRLSLRSDGKLRRHWGTALHVARRKGE
jgi:SAM-dependent methyltransferase